MSGAHVLNVPFCTWLWDHAIIFTTHRERAAHPTPSDHCEVRAPPHHPIFTAPLVATDITTPAAPIDGYVAVRGMLSAAREWTTSNQSLLLWPHWVMAP